MFKVQHFAPLASCLYGARQCFHAHKIDACLVLVGALHYHCGSQRRAVGFQITKWTQSAGLT
jgi:hypothetical protein